MSKAHIGKKTNVMMSGLICSCSHDYVCHNTVDFISNCCECDCTKTRVHIVDDFVAEYEIDKASSNEVDHNPT